MTEAIAPRHWVRSWPLAFVGGVAALGVYLASTLCSYLLYPGPFDPRDNWLSDLGNGALNPSGALVYNAGVVLTGLALLAFFGGLRRSVAADAHVRRRIRAVRLLGYVGAITTAGTALISESVDADLHGLVSMTNIEFLGAAAALSGLVLYRQPGFWRPIAVVALATEVAALVFGFLLHTYWMEWLTVGLVLGYVGLMALNDRPAAAVMPVGA
jgi:hypothetical membrane protein